MFSSSTQHEMCVAIMTYFLSGDNRKTFGRHALMTNVCQQTATTQLNNEEAQQKRQDASHIDNKNAVNRSLPFSPTPPLLLYTTHSFNTGDKCVAIAT